MPILDLQKRFRELGRIRMGTKVKAGRGSRPSKLKTWRLTSASEALLGRAAEIYGGEVKVWEDAPTEGEQFELITETDSLPILIPPGDQILSQWWELWSGGGCRRRCDGQRQVLRDVNCACPEDLEERQEKAGDGKACSPTTRLSVLLPEIPDLGVWRIESHGINAALEMSATLGLVRDAIGEGRTIPAHLRIEHRTIKREGKVKRNFTVPVIALDSTVVQIAGSLVSPEAAAELGLEIAPIEAKALPGAPVLPAAPVEIEEGSTPGPKPKPKATPPSSLSEWILDLPGEDYEVLDAASIVAGDRGKPREFRRLSDLEDAPEDFQEQLREKVEEIISERESDREVREIEETADPTEPEKVKT